MTACAAKESPAIILATRRTSAQYSAPATATTHALAIRRNVGIERDEAAHSVQCDSSGLVTQCA